MMTPDRIGLIGIFKFTSNFEVYVPHSWGLYLEVDAGYIVIVCPEGRTGLTRVIVRAVTRAITIL